jgi:hypothetical protein
MARPRNSEASVVVEVTIPPKLVRYLDALKDKGGFGVSRPDVVREFVWKEVNRLIEVGRLEEIE